MSVGDYTFILPNYPELDMDRKVIVERKGSLDELAGNFTKNRERFRREFERMEDGQVMHLVLENFTWRKLLAGSYRSKFNPKAYKASLITWSILYDFKAWNVVGDYAARSDVAKKQVAKHGIPEFDSLSLWKVDPVSVYDNKYSFLQLYLTLK